MRVGLLHHVLGLGIVVDHAARDAEQALVAALHEVAERLAVAALRQTHQCSIVQCGIGDAVGVGGRGHGCAPCH